MARLLLEDVTLRKEEKVIVQVRFKGGALEDPGTAAPLALLRAFAYPAGGD